MWTRSEKLALLSVVIAILAFATPEIRQHTGLEDAKPAVEAEGGFRSRGYGELPKVSNHASIDSPIEPVAQISHSTPTNTTSDLATLNVKCDAAVNSANDLFVFVNGKRLGEAYGNGTTSFTFEAAKDGANELKLQTRMFEGTTDEEVVKFPAMPGSSTGVSVNIGHDTFFQHNVISANFLSAN